MTFKIWGNEDITRLNAGGKNNITALPNGGYVVSWTEKNKAHFQRYDGAGSKVGGAQAVEMAGGNQMVTDIQAYGTGGDFVVSWNESSGSSNGWSIKSRIFKADGTVGETQTLASNLIIGNLDRPAIASTNGGGFVTAYDNGTAIVLSVHDAEGAIIAPFENVVLTANAQYADVATIGDDAYVVSYALNGQVWYRTMSVNGADGIAVQVGAGSRSDIVALKDADGNADGRFAVIYNEGDVVRARLSNGNASVVVSEDGLNDADFVSATALRGGRVAVVYIETVYGPDGRVSDNGDVFVRIIEADGQPGAKLLVNARATLDGYGQQYTPAISEMADGRVAVTWHDPSYPGGTVLSTTIVDPRIAPVTVEGTARDDIYYGSEYAQDILRGHGGNDRLYGDAGDDILHGGAGADRLDGGAGSDWADYTGGAGLTASLAGAFPNTGDAAGDTYVSIENLRGTNFNDVLAGNEVANIIEGGGGDDRLYGGAAVAADTLDGGAAWNIATYEYSTAGTGITLNLRDHTKSTGEAKGDVFLNIMAYGGTHYADTFVGVDTYNEFFGHNGNDTLIGGQAGDHLDGGNHNDVLHGGAGSDTLVGGDGIDFASYESATAGITASLADRSRNTGDAAGDTYDSIEGLIGGSGNDTLIGNDLNNTLVGGAGADALVGGTGSDTASYERSNAAVVINLASGLGAGGHAQGDTFESIENVIGSSFNDTLIGNASANVLLGGAGTDTVDYSGSTAGVTVVLSGVGSGGDAQGDTYGSIENVVGTNFADALYGDGAANVLYGGGGNDILDGRGGADVMHGGAGDDTYYVDGTDVISEAGGSGYDTVMTAANFTLGADFEALTATGSGALILTGNALNNTITGNAAGNWIDGGVGADTMIGGAGDDIYVIDDVGDVIIDNEGQNTVLLKTAYDLSNLPPSVSVSIADGVNTPLTGTNGANVLRGNAAANILKGQGGNDTLYGLTGNDKLYGGSGKDVFVFDTRLNKTKNVDKIYDFKSKDDSIWLDNAIFTKLGKGAPIKPVKFKSGMFHEGKKAHDKDDRIIYDKKTGALYYDQDGTGSKAQVKFATLTNKAKLYYHDFFVI